MICQAVSRGILMFGFLSLCNPSVSLRSPAPLTQGSRQVFPAKPLFVQGVLTLGQRSLEYGRN